MKTRAVAHTEDTSAPSVDWSSWDEPLRRFADVTGMVVSAVDAQGQRRVGPHAGTPFGTMLTGSALFGPDGEASTQERLLVSAVCAQPSASSVFHGQLRVHAVPVRRGSRTVGAVVIGWVFHDYPTSVGCERLASVAALPGRRVWSLARLEIPVSDTRMTSHVGLLATMLSWEGRLAHAAADVRRLELAREAFLAHVSHELRTPLNALALRLEVLARTTDGEVVARTVEAMRRHVRDQARLVDDLLDVAVTRSGAFALQVQDVDLHAVVVDAVDAVQPAAQARGVRLSVEGHADRMPVRVDPVRLRQAIWNVVSNAVKFTPAGGRVDVAFARERDGWAIHVLDDGPGIPSSMLSAIFEPFVRAARDNVGGLGLGLVIASQILALHGGSIEAISPAGERATRMTLRLPATSSPDRDSPPST